MKHAVINHSAEASITIGGAAVPPFLRPLVDTVTIPPGGMFALGEPDAADSLAELLLVLKCMLPGWADSCS